MPKRKANMRKRFFEKIETGSNKDKSGRLWTRKAQRLSKNIGGRIGSELTENLRKAYGSKIKFLLKDLQQTIKNTKSQKGQNLRRKYLDDKYLKELDKDKSFLIDSKYNLIKGLKSINEVKQELKQENYKNSTIEKFLRPYREILRERMGLKIKEPSIGKPYNSALADEIERSFLKKSEFNQGGLAERIQKRIGGKIVKKAGEKIYYHLTATKNVKNIKDKGFNPLADTNFVKAGGDRYQKDMGLFLFTNPIAALKFAKSRFWRQLGDKDEKLKIIPVKLKPGTVVKTDTSGDPDLGSNAMNKLGLDEYAKQNYPTHSVFVSANNNKNIGNFLNKDIILSKGKTIGELIRNPKNPSKKRNIYGDKSWYPREEDLSKKILYKDPDDKRMTYSRFVMKKQSKKQMQEYLKEIDKLLID